MTVSSHNKHIEKLIKKGWSDKDIYNDIKKIYGIHYSLAQINNKRNTKLNDLIKPFKEDSEELLFPILYKGFPNKDFINDKLEQIINYLIDAINTVKDFPSEDVLIDLLLVFEQGLNTYKHDAFLYSLIFKYKNNNNNKLEDSLEIQQLKIFIENPFKNYFSLSNTNMENVSFKDDSPEFDHIIKEVCRDNVITKNEREYLKIKAAEYFINTEKLERYLNNPFFGYETFKVFIDQVCEDCIITDLERDYIKEKAVQYNVPLDQMNKMISNGLMRASFTRKLINSREFYDIVLSYLFSNSFNFQNTENILFDAIQSEKLNSVQDIKLVRDQTIYDLKNKFSRKSYFNGEWSNLTELFQKINISFISFEKALLFYKQKENQKANLSIVEKKDSIETIQEKIYIDSLKIEDVIITKSNKLARPFDVKFLGSKICIEYSDEIDEIVLVKALSVFYLKNSKTISKTNLLKQLNRILEQLLNERN